MKTLKKFSWVNIAGLFVLILLVAGCATGKSIRSLSPVQPPDTLPEKMVLDDSNPRQFKVTAKQPILSMTQNDVTVSICYWRRADLDYKYNRGNAYSPFYETEGLHQGEKTDVFYVKITNNADTPVIYRVKGTPQTPAEIIDQGDNRYGAKDYKDLENRLLYMSRARGLYVKNGLAKAREILLEKQIGHVEKGILPGESREGFVPFARVKGNAETLDVIIPVELAPPLNTAARYKRLTFKFPFKHTLGIRNAQPSPKRH
jgi:hypothetical protein